jgi:general secretion pathway protein J
MAKTVLATSGVLCSRKSHIFARYTGFTLLELLVALAVFVIMSVAAYSGLRSILSAQAHVEAQAQRLAQVQMAFRFIKNDIEQIIPRDIRDEYGDLRPALESDDISGNLLVFTRSGWDNPLEHPRSTLQRVAYRVEEERLFRLHWNTLDRSGINEPHKTMLLDNIQAARVRFLDGTTEDEWQTVWPPTENKEKAVSSLPRAVELSITLNDWGEILRLFLLSDS